MLRRTDGGEPGARRAEVLAALSIAIDLGLGLPMEHVLRSSLLAAMLADELELSQEQRDAIYYTAAMRTRTSSAAGSVTTSRCDETATSSTGRACPT